MNEIKCNVNSCVYHEGKTTCTADEIMVGCQCSHEPCTSNETECGTFRPKD